MFRYQKEGLREEIRQALLVEPRTRGQLEGFETAAYRSEFARVKRRKVIIGTNDDGTDNCIYIKPEIVRTLACKTFKQSPMPLHPRTFQFKKLVKVVNQAPNVQADWLNYCYSDLLTAPSQKLVNYILGCFYVLETENMHAASREFTRLLALLAIQQMRQVVNTGKGSLSQIKIAEMSGKSYAVWTRRWSKRWNRLLAIVEKIDSEGLDYVYERQRRQSLAKKRFNLLMQRSIQIAARNEIFPRMAS